MKRKLVSLFLVSAMLLACFAMAGCSTTTDDEDLDTDLVSDAVTTATLTLWIPTDENTTEEALALVEEAINKITKAKLDTAIELHAIPSDEYEAAIADRITEIEERIIWEEEEAARKKEEAKTADSSETSDTSEESDEESVSEAETYKNEIGMSVLKYPDVEATQMDIFLIRGYDNYVSYINRDALSSLDDELTSSSKVLKEYIYPFFLDYAKVDGTTYAIPNNHMIGEYEYLLVNKRLVEELYWNPEKLTTLWACRDFIMDVKERTNVTPMLAPAEAAGIRYWSEDGEFSALISQVKNDALYETAVTLSTVFGVRDYYNTTYLMKLLEENDCFAKNSDTTEEFGVAVISGDATIPEQYEDEYYVYIHENPTAYEDDIYGAMFGVSTYTADLGRSMEVITLLNTNKELRTVLQYGVEGVHWQVNEYDDSVIDVISNDYVMNLVETGNTYMTYPAAGVSMDYWEYAKQQNLDAKVDPLLGFGPDKFITSANRSDFADLKKLSAELYNRIEAMSAEEFNENIKALRSEYNKNEVITRFTNAESNTSLATLLTDFNDAKNY